MTFIDTYWARFGAEPICAVLSEHGISIAPSTYYARRSMPVTSAELEDTYLANLLVTLHREIWSAYGMRKLWHAARRQGLELGRVQVDRLMGIAGVVRGRHTTRTTRREEKAARHPNLVQRSWDALTGPDQLWVADFSYVWTLAGFVYVAFVVDAFSRRILGWRVATSMRTFLVTDALRQAIDTRHRNGAYWEVGKLAYHSDAGAQPVHLAGRDRGARRGRHRRLDRHCRRRAAQRAVRVHHPTVQDRSDPRRRPDLEEPGRGRVAGLRMGPLAQPPPAALRRRTPAAP